MNKHNLRSGIATLAGFLFLIATFHFVVANFSAPENQNSALLVGNIFLISMGLYFWIGPGEERLGVTSAGHWFAMMIGAVILTTILFLMDCGTGFLFRSSTAPCEAGTHGIGFVFTLAAAGFALLSLAGTLRSIVLTWLRRRN